MSHYDDFKENLIKEWEESMKKHFKTNQTEENIVKALECPLLDDVEIEEFTKEDVVNYPKHYRKHPSGVECIQVTEHMSFCLGNAVKYIWRAGEKGNTIQDLQKAVWYINREISRLEGNE